MKKIIIKHLAGSKTNQTEAFELPIEELLFGRESNCQVIFDPTKDDLVSRAHCKISVQNENQFLLTDLNSKNGTYLNSALISGSQAIYPGDEVMLGKNGARFEFDLDPRPPAIPKATRLGDSASPLAATVEYRVEEDLQPDMPTQVNYTQNKPTFPSASNPPPKPSGIGKETLMREINLAETNSRKKMVNYVAGIIGLVLAVSGFFLFQNYQDKNQLEQAIVKINEDSSEKIAALQANQALSSAEIFKKYANSTVLIEMSWKLIHTSTGKQLFQKVECTQVEQGRCVAAYPVYKSLNGVVEPELTVDDGLPIGGAGSGTGFVVNEKGFILTNRHVAANWETAHSDFKPGILKVCQDARCAKFQVAALRQNDLQMESLQKWVPSKALFKPSPGELKGRIDFMDVTFPSTGLRIPAQLARVSDSADVALIKIEIPEGLQPVEMSAEDPVAAGDSITVVGYPAISPDVMVKINSQDPFNRSSQVRQIPEPTVTGGNIGKIIQGAAKKTSDSVGEYFSEVGDAYQLTVNATGSGNSGGPVFNDKGHVIGIFSSKRAEMGTAISFAVPIKYGLEIMGINKLIQ